MQTLPTDMLLEMFQYLSDQELHLLAQTASKMNPLCNNFIKVREERRLEKIQKLREIAKKASKYKHVASLEFRPCPCGNIILLEEFKLEGSWEAIKSELRTYGLKEKEIMGAMATVICMPCGEGGNDKAHLCKWFSGGDKFCSRVSQMGTIGTVRQNDIGLRVTNLNYVKYLKDGRPGRPTLNKLLKKNKNLRDLNLILKKAGF